MSDILERAKNAIGSGQKTTHLPRLLDTSDKLIEAAAKEVAFSPALVYLDETPILWRSSINIVQGKTGVHKSRLAELFASLILSNRGCKTDFLGFSRYNFGTGYYVAYIDTERSITEEFPYSIQQIREKAGYDKKEQPGNFFPTSIKAVARRERLDATKEWIEYVRKRMAADGVHNWQLFVVLDVVTDCVASFNRDNESMELYDYLGNLCDDYGATFLLVIHENPGSDKARGHLGTEGGHKSGAVMQVGFEKDAHNDDTDLIRLKFVKLRRAGKPKPLYLRYDTDVKGLVLADDEFIRDRLNERRLKADIDLVRDLVENLFADATEWPQKEIIAQITREFECSRNTAVDRLKEIVASGNGLSDMNGNACRLIEERQTGKPTVYRLGKVDHKDETEQADDDDDIPF